MKGRIIALDHLDDQEAAALLVDGQLDDLLIDPKTDLRPGAIFRGKVRRAVKGQGGLFLDLGGEMGFLRQGRGVSEGAVITVQVSGHAEPGKAVPVSPKLTFKGRYAIATPGAPGINVSKAIRDEEERGRVRFAAGVEAEDLGELGLILRSACAGAAEEDIAQDVAEVLGAASDAAGAQNIGLVRPAEGAHFCAWRDWVDPAEVVTRAGCFEDLGVLDAIEGLGARTALAGGGSFWIEPTRALVAVDVNTGTDTSPAAALKANLAVCAALPRALRIQGLGGQIVIDFAPLPKKDRRQVEGALLRALRACPVETNFIGWTPLGHAELTRKRERVPLAEVLG